MRPPMFFGSADATVATDVAFWVVFYVWIGTELWLGSRRRRLPPGATDHDAGSKWWLIGSIWSSVVIGFWVALLFPGAAIKTGRTALFIVGLILILAGMALRFYSIRVLGTSFTCEVSTRPGQEVIESGPYRWVRHPSYTGSLLTVLGVLICCENWAALAALIVAIGGYANRIRIEERALEKGLGPAYSDYMRRTKRLFPFLV